MADQTGGQYRSDRGQYRSDRGQYRSDMGSTQIRQGHFWTNQMRGVPTDQPAQCKWSRSTREGIHVYLSSAFVPSNPSFFHITTSKVNPSYFAFIQCTLLLMHPMQHTPLVSIQCISSPHLIANHRTTPHRPSKQHVSGSIITTQHSSSTIITRCILHHCNTPHRPSSRHTILPS